MGRRFILAGLSRLTVRVAGLLAATPECEAVVLAWAEDPSLAARLPQGTRVLQAGEDREDSLRTAGAAGASAILALDDDDRANLELALIAPAAAPGVPLVIRAFDPALTSRLEEDGLVRRAYSVSALAAPAFVAQALADHVVHTLRLGEDNVPLLRLAVTPGGPLEGASPAGLRERRGVSVVARRGAAGDWHPDRENAGALAAGEEVVMGGEQAAVLRVALDNAKLPAASLKREPTSREKAEERRRRGVTLLPFVVATLAVVLLTDVVVFGVALHKDPIDALYFAITTAFGDPGLSGHESWLKVFGVVSMLSSAAMVGVVFTQLASIATANRLETRMGRRAGRMSGHAVVVGLGTVGYRLERLLSDLGVPTVVLERDPDSRFVSAVGERTPVLIGDVRLREHLERAGVQRAAMLFACTQDDLVNLAACLQAERMNPARIRTVARVFDDTLAERIRTTFGIDAAISTTQVAAAAFAGAATDEFARRPFELGGTPWLALRWDPPGELSATELLALRADGVSVLAGAGDNAGPGRAVAVAGPAPAVRRLLGETD